MLIESSKSQNHLLVTITEDILMDNSRDFMLEFDKLYKDMGVGLENLTLNFGEVRFLDSSGIGAIIKCTGRAKDNGVKIRVLNLNKTLVAVFRLSGLQHILTTVELDDFMSEFPDFLPQLRKYNEY